MIFVIGGKAINPDHVSFVEYRAGSESAVVHFSNGKNIEVRGSRETVIDGINNALSWEQDQLARTIRGLD